MLDAVSEFFRPWRQFLRMCIQCQINGADDRETEGDYLFTLLWRDGDAESGE